MDWGYPVQEISSRLGVSCHGLYAWIKKARANTRSQDAIDLEKVHLENLRLKAELKRIQEERDILKKSRRVLCQGIRARSAFIESHRSEFRIVAMCRVLRVQRSWFYAWLKQPLSARAKDNERLFQLIKECYLASGGSYGSPRIHKDLLELGDICGEKRVTRLMKVRPEGLAGYRKSRNTYGRPSILAPNRLGQQFSFSSPDQAWATDIAYIGTSEGWLYLTVVLDLFSRMVVGWSMKESLHRELVLDAMLMAVWRRRPKQKVLIPTL